MAPRIYTVLPQVGRARVAALDTPRLCNASQNNGIPAYLWQYDVIRVPNERARRGGGEPPWPRMCSPPRWVSFSPEVIRRDAACIHAASRRRTGGEKLTRREAGGMRGHAWRVPPRSALLGGGGSAWPRVGDGMRTEFGRAGGTGKRLLWAECIHGLRLLGSEFGRAGGTEKDSRVPGADRGEGFAAFARCGSDLDRSKGKALELARVGASGFCSSSAFPWREKENPANLERLAGLAGFRSGSVRRSGRSSALPYPPHGGGNLPDFPRRVKDYFPGCCHA